MKDMIHFQGQEEAVANAKPKGADVADPDLTRQEGAKTPPLSILCLPARTEADEIIAIMLSQLLGEGGHVVQSIAAASLSSEIVDLVEKYKPDVLCLSATPPAAAMHARYLCKRLRDRLPNVHLVVGLWDTQADLSKAKERIGCNAIVVSSLADAQEQIRLLTLPR